MTDTDGMDRAGIGLFGSQLALGLILGGWLLGTEIKATRLSDRYVSVHGLAERTVKSDLAIWPISYREAGDDLPSLYSKTEADRNVILQFLGRQGIQAAEIEMGIVRVVDNQANEFAGPNRAPHRYIIEQQITVVTSRVDQVAAGAQKTMDLVQQGIVLNADRGGRAGV